MTQCQDCNQDALPGRSRCKVCWKANLKAYESEIGWKMPKHHPCVDCATAVVNPVALRCRSCARKAHWQNRIRRMTYAELVARKSR